MSKLVSNAFSNVKANTAGVQAAAAALLNLRKLSVFQDALECFRGLGGDGTGCEILRIALFG